MNGQVYQALPEEVTKWVSPIDMPWVNASSPLLVGMYKGECQCILGAIPTSVLSPDVAYLWLWTPPSVPKIVFARHAKKVVPKLLEVYPTLICNCYNEASARWLRSLGAKPYDTCRFKFERP